MQYELPRPIAIKALLQLPCEFWFRSTAKRLVCSKMLSRSKVRAFLPKENTFQYKRYSYDNVALNIPEVGGLQYLFDTCVIWWIF